MNIFSSTAEGVTGLVKQPADGVKKEGVKGLFKGLGKGVAGLAAKPISAGIDTVSNIITTVGHKLDVNFQLIQRARFSRFIDTTNSESLLCYDEFTARGLMVFQRIKIDNVNYEPGDYVYHVNITLDNFTDIDQPFEAPITDPVCMFRESGSRELIIVKATQSLIISENYLIAIKKDDVPESVEWLVSWIVGKNELGSAQYEPCDQISHNWKIKLPIKLRQDFPFRRNYSALSRLSYSQEKTLIVSKIVAEEYEVKKFCNKLNNWLYHS